MSFAQAVGNTSNKPTAIIPLDNPQFPANTKIKLSARDESIAQNIIDGNGLCESHIVNFIASTLKHGDTFIDVGANIGYLTLLSSHIVGPHGRVISFEPSSINAGYCRDNINLNDLTNVTLLNYGLWFEDTTMEIITPPTFLGGAHLSIKDSNLSTNHKESISCTTLDKIVSLGELSLEHLHLIKMDIEGAEPFALDGMVNTIKHFKPMLIIEINRHYLRKFFHLDSDAVWRSLVKQDYDILTFSEQSPLAKELCSPKRISGFDLYAIHGLDTLNTICPENALIDIVALPKS